MAIYKKVDGVWVISEQPYHKINNSWTDAKAVYRKISGVWTKAFELDLEPSEAPQLSLEVIDGRYIRVGVRVATVDADLKKIRLLVSRSEFPATQFGSGYIQTPDDTYPYEPWSDWYYNGRNPANTGSHGAETNTWFYKQYPVNPTESTNLPGGQFYYFAAWTEDKSGNWSAGTSQKIWKPKIGSTYDSVAVKEARFGANFSGSAQLNGASYLEGELIQQESPRRNGFWFYGNEITQSVGERGTPTIRNAQIRVTRGNDAGQATANVNLFWHGANTPSNMPVLDANRNNITKVGTINKGETKWFEIPSSYYGFFNTQIKGFGLSYGIQASDYMVADGLATDFRSGEVRVVWEESL